MQVLSTVLRVGFLRGTGARLNVRTRPAYRRSVEAATVAGKPGARVVIAPEAWPHWQSLPPARWALAP